MIAFLNEVNDVIFFDREHYKQISIVGTFQIHPSSGLVGLYGLKGEKPDPIYYRSNKRLPSLKGIVPWAFVPKSMRLGIVETLVMMGGDEARAGLVVALNTTRDGFEVAMLDVCFRMMETPNQKELVTNVIHKILNEFPDYPQTNFEQSSREYLFTLLVKYNDHRYVLARSQNRHRRRRHCQRDQPIQRKNSRAPKFLEPSQLRHHLPHPAHNAAELKQNPHKHKQPTPHQPRHHQPRPRNRVHRLQRRHPL